MHDPGDGYWLKSCTAMCYQSYFIRKQKIKLLLKRQFHWEDLNALQYHFLWSFDDVWERVDYCLINAIFCASLLMRRLGVKKELPSHVGKSLGITLQGINPTGFSRNYPEISKLLGITLIFLWQRMFFPHIFKKPKLYYVIIWWSYIPSFYVLLKTIRSTHWKVTVFC